MQETAGQPETSDPLSVLYAHNGIVYLGTLGSGIFYSSDQGITWHSLNNNLPQSAKWIMSFTVLGDSLYAGSGNTGVYRLNLLSPENWLAVNDGLIHYGVNTLGNTGENIIAGIGMYLFVKPRYNDQWADVYLDSVEIQRQVFETLTVGDLLFVGTDNGVYKSTDHGYKWETADIMQFPGADIVALVHNGERLFAGLLYRGQHWIFSSDNDGQSWDIHAHEFSLLYDLLTTEKRIWAGRGDGLWYREMENTTAVDPHEPWIPSAYSLEQNYPNPFNPSTTISFQMAQAGLVRIDLFDIQGRHLETLLNSYKNAGNHNLNFDGSQLASGVYFYQMTAGQQVLNKKMICIK